LWCQTVVHLTITVVIDPITQGLFDLKLTECLAVISLFAREPTLCPTASSDCSFTLSDLICAGLGSQIVIDLSVTIIIQTVACLDDRQHDPNTVSPLRPIICADMFSGSTNTDPFGVLGASITDLFFTRLTERTTIERVSTCLVLFALLFVAPL
tara:strand:- start:2663 stop:3124 length:462 start_codon:yes stop_codon:yes gene_type:complete